MAFVNLHDVTVRQRMAIVTCILSLLAFVATLLPILAKTYRNAEVSSLAWFEDGQRLALTSTYFDDDFMTDIRIVNSHTGNELAQYGYPGTLNAIAVSPDVRLLAIGREDERVEVFDLKHSAHLFFRLENKLRHPTSALSFAADSEYLAAVTYRYVEIWRITDQEARFIRVVDGHRAQFGNHNLFVLSGDGDIRALELDTRGIQKTRQVRTSEPIKKMTVSARGDRIVAQSASDRLAVIDTAANDSFIFLDMDSAHPTAFSIDPSGKRVVCAADDKKVRVFRATDGSLEKRYDIQLNVELLGPTPDGKFSISPDGKLLAVAGGALHASPDKRYPEFIAILDIETGRIVFTSGSSSKMSLAVSLVTITAAIVSFGFYAFSRRLQHRPIQT